MSHSREPWWLEGSLGRGGMALAPQGFPFCSSHSNFCYKGGSTSLMNWWPRIQPCWWPPAFACESGQNGGQLSALRSSMCPTSGQSEKKPENSALSSNLLGLPGQTPSSTCTCHLSHWGQNRDCHTQSRHEKTESEGGEGFDLSVGLAS